MKKVGYLFLGIFLCSITVVFAQYSLPKLSYAYNALEPYIDAETMNIHYNNHHAAYVNNLNNALKSYPELSKKEIGELLRDLNEVPESIRTAVRNNGGGHYNHTLFWSILAPANSVPMSPALEKKLTESFGSVDAFKAEFEKEALGRFGSGWVWLIKDKNEKLRIVSTPNQDNPIMPMADVKGEPVLALDVWEHAYYLKYQSKRVDYAKAFWQVVNWNEVERLIN